MEITAELLFAKIGSQAVELDHLRNVVSTQSKQVADLQKEIADLQKQVAVANDAAATRSASSGAIMPDPSSEGFRSTASAR